MRSWKTGCVLCICLVPSSDSPLLIPTLINTHTHTHTERETHSPGPECSQCWPLRMWVRVRGQREGGSQRPTQMGHSPTHTHTLRWTHVHTLREVRVHLEKLWSPSIHQFYYRAMSKQRVLERCKTETEWCIGKKTPRKDLYRTSISKWYL